MKKLKISTRNPMGAVLDGEKRYRYILWRCWDDKLPLLNFIGLNPSRANAEVNDPTIVRLINYAKSWGYGGFVITNLFAIRSADPGRILQVKDPIGPENDEWIIKGANLGEKIVLMWGNNGIYYKRNTEVLNLLSDINVIELECFRITNDGHPSHPLYLSKHIEPTAYTYE